MWRHSMSDDIDEERLRKLLGGQTYPSGLDDIREQMRLGQPRRTFMDENLPEIGLIRPSLPTAPPISPVPALGCFGFIVGIALTIWACIGYRPFDPNVAFLSQRHWWLILAIYILNPRGLAVYYIMCAQPSVGHWGQNLILGCLLIPGGWGAYMLPGLGVPHATRLVWGIAGSLVLDVVLRPALQYHMLRWVAEVKRAAGRAADEVKKRRYAAMAYSGVILCVIGWVWILSVADYEKTISDLKPVDTIQVFWPNNTFRDPGGYLVSEKCVPLRAIARRPGVCFYDAADAAVKRGADHVIGYMDTWCPYYVFDRNNDAILIGRTPAAKEAERYWVHAGECFCWTTRECVSLEDGVALYRTPEEAKARASPLEPAYRYAFTEHFSRDKSSKARFHIAALPVLDRKDRTLWCVVRPEGGKEGYQLCWFSWDGRAPDAHLRIRTTRDELETYLAGIMRLLREYTNPETKDRAHVGLYRTGVDYLIKGDISGASGMSLLKTQLEGVPNLMGFLDRPIENDIQYSEVKKRALKLLEWSNTEDVWDAYEVSYPESESLP